MNAHKENNEAATRKTLSRLQLFAMELGEAYSGHDQDSHRICLAIVAAAKEGCPVSVLVQQTARMMNTFKSGTEAWAKLGCLQVILTDQIPFVDAFAA